MYTSGSTGTPKGVTVTHRDVVNGVLALAHSVGIGPGTRVLAGTSVNFDVSVFEIVTTLAHGGVVEVVQDVLALAERGGWSGGVVSTVPSVLAGILDQVGGKIHADAVVFAGEALPAALVDRVRDAIPGVRVINAYGQSGVVLRHRLHRRRDLDRHRGRPHRHAAAQYAHPCARPRPPARGPGSRG
ncbi:AMP-binding protein [Streptomyces sp. G45]|uniref:AMP-binding protein n=1 Tax=Streptomyces sp. G45 TaxID=3406627 RepID=UPI003C257ADA